MNNDRKPKIKKLSLEKAREERVINNHRIMNAKLKKLSLQHPQSKREEPADEFSMMDEKMLKNTKKDYHPTHDDESDDDQSLESVGTTSDTHVSESWRVENVRSGGPPVASDWWMNGEEPKKRRSKAIFSCFVEEDKSRRGESHERTKRVSCVRSGPKAGEFRNCGLVTWKKVRFEWKQQTVRRPPPPPPVHIEPVRAGLSQLRRTYELPGRMNLAKIIDVYVDIWEQEELRAQESMLVCKSRNRKRIGR